VRLRFYYPRRGGIQRLYEAALKKARGRVAVRLGEAVREVKRAKRQACHKRREGRSRNRRGSPA